MTKQKKSTFKVLFYLKKSSPNKNGLVPIMDRITIDEGIAQFSTKTSCDSTQWDLKFGRISGRKLSVTIRHSDCNLLVQWCVIHNFADNYVVLSNSKLTKKSSESATLVIVIKVIFSLAYFRGILKTRYFSNIIF